MALVPVTIYGAQFTSAEITFLTTIADHSYTDGQLLIGNGSTHGVSISTLTQGTGITITNSHGTITISSNGGGYQVPLTGALTGTNTWTTAPNVIVIDGVPKQQTSTDGTINWTGTTTTILIINPTFDIFAID